MANVTGVPVQVAKVGVTVIEAVPIVVGVKDVIFPVPDAPIPIEALEFVQLYVVFPLFPVKFIAFEELPKQIVCVPGFVTVGFVFTVAKTGILAEVHPLDVNSA
jgi:hypothetical protein